MDVDILLTGVTGFVGRFVLHELLERDTKRIAVIIRSSGKKSATQRWTEEIVGSTLFAPWTDRLREVRVIDAAIENIETTTHQLNRVTTLIHCAANIKHYDPYEALERDNVGNVKRILTLAESLHVQHLLLLSTCYVHPRQGQGHGQGQGQGQGRPCERIAEARQSDFYNDYCYTKWLGEEAVFAAKPRMAVTIARLSCVGAPVRWDLGHPCPAQAHLGILSLALRGYVETLAWRPSARIATVPVDIVAKALVDRAHEEAAGTQILQLCAPPTLTAYHISLPLVVSTLQSEFGLEDFRGLTREDSRGQHLAWWKQVAYACMSRGRQALTLHNHVQDFVSTFTDEDIRFQSSLLESDFPAKDEREVARDTCAYAVRILHFRQLSRGVPVSRLDQFWHRLANREPVQVQIKLTNAVGMQEWPDLQKRLWTFFLSHQKYGAGISHESPLDGPLTWKRLSGHSISAYFGTPQKLAEDRILSWGLQQSPERLWHITPITNGTEITHLLIRADHGLTDGVGAAGLLQDMSTHVFEEESRQETLRQPRALGLWMDLWMGIVYIALMAVMWSAPTMESEGHSKEPTIATETVEYEEPPSGRTYTTDLLWRLTQYFTAVKRQPEHIFAVPAVSALYRPAKDMPTNAFVPILLPVDGRMSEEAFTHRCMLLRAKSVRFLSWCLVQLLEWGVWDEIRDAFLGKVRCVVSSIQTGSKMPLAFESAHVVTTTPTPIPYCITAVSARGRVFLTARSHDPTVAAADILRGIGKK